jgi:RNA polymerase sigma factor (sigma-70 family)
LRNFERSFLRHRIHLQEHIVEPVKPELIPTRQTLLVRLRDVDNHDSWREFFETYWKLIYSAATKAGLSDAEAQDVVQETVISVYKSLPNFEYDPKLGSFKGWLLKLTRWRIVDQLRKRRPDSAIPDPSAAVPESYWDEEWERNVFDTAIERTKQRVDPRQFQIFDLYVLKEWKVAKVREALGVSATQVYLAKHRVGREIKKQIKAVEKQQPPRKKK